MKARLAVLKDGRLDYGYPLNETLTTIGRDAGNLVQLPHVEVSKRHAIIHAKDGGWAIEDLKSTNGVQVNGAPVTRTALKNGDRIRIGPFEIVFETGPDDAEWAPTFVIDMSTKVNLNTMVQDRDPRRNRPTSVR